MKKNIPKILISIGAFIIFLISVNSASAFTTFNNNYSYSDCNSSWTTPVGCNGSSGYYYNNLYPLYPNNTNQQYYYNDQAGKPTVNNYYQITTRPITKTSTSNISRKSSATTAKKKITSIPSKTSKSNSVNFSNKKTDLTKSLNKNNLTALSLGGSGGFLPSSFWQWLIVIALILVIVILTRLINKSIHRKDDDPVNLVH